MYESLYPSLSCQPRPSTHKVGKVVVTISRAVRDIRLLLLAVIFLASTPVANAQIIQLPSVRTFSYSGGVLVPDGGTAPLGGGSSYANGGTSRRWNPSMGTTMRTGGASVSVHIIDHDEIDRQLLGDADPRRQSYRKQFELQHTDVTDAKTLVRNARLLLQRGERSRSQGVYELAIIRLSRLMNLSQPKRSGWTQVDKRNDPAHLLAYAKAEFARTFPEVSR